MEKQELGRAGEDVAAGYLSRLGWRILERNWRCPAGELDIVACEPCSPEVVVFCEVKCRSGSVSAHPWSRSHTPSSASCANCTLHWLRAQSRPCHGSGSTASGCCSLPAARPGSAM